MGLMKYLLDVRLDRKQKYAVYLMINISWNDIDAMREWCTNANVSTLAFVWLRRAQTQLNCRAALPDLYKVVSL